jgi:DNA-binding NarL/FixJ family response regulator
VDASAEPERKARLFGASEAILENVGAPLYAQVQDRAAYERAVEGLRSRLGRGAFVAAWAEGRAMSTEEAVEYALKAGEPAGYRSQDATSASPSPLSAREAEVLALAAEGLTDARAAERLYVSPRTVGRNLHSAYRKLGVSSKAAAVREAIERGLI